MHIHFYKYQGAGNDFIIIDQYLAAQSVIPNDASIIQKLCHRQLGIGADGIIFLQKHPCYDFEMVYCNPDASQSFCGNGSRCAVHLAHHLQIIRDKTKFVSMDKVYTAAIQAGNISISLHDVANIQRVGNDYFVDTGSPHYIRLVDDEAFAGDLVACWKLVNNTTQFKSSLTNVNFVKLLKNNTIAIRTYERGVNVETLSCGTGAVAAALVSATHGYSSPIEVTTPGGRLQVGFQINNGVFTKIHLIGPATLVFQGQINVGILQQ